jgi:hypothetical protein
MPPRERHAGGLWLVALRVGVEVLVIVSLAYRGRVESSIAASGCTVQRKWVW